MLGNVAVSGHKVNYLHGARLPGVFDGGVADDAGSVLRVGDFHGWREPGMWAQLTIRILGIREMDVIIDELAAPGRRVEVVERKGVGHPDTICDAVADHFERALCRYYRDTFGQVLHHNVDKALLIAGAATPAFGGGSVDAPIEIVLGGRATSEFQGRSVPVAEIAEQSVREWFGEHMHALDPDRHVRLRCAVRGGSSELTGLFDRGARPLANDTSIGVGFWPLTGLEAQVLAIESHVNGLSRNGHPEIGEDVKVLGVRVDDDVSFTVGCALVDRHLPDLQGYSEAKETLATSIRSRSRGA